VDEKLLERKCPKCYAKVGHKCVSFGKLWDEAVHNARRDEYLPDFKKEHVVKRAHKGPHRATKYRAYLERKAKKAA